MDNLTTLYYVGNVKVKLKIKDKIVEINNHNEGLPALSRTFAKCITGTTITNNDIPQYLDLWKNDASYLSKLPSLSGKYFEFDSSADVNNWVAKFTAVIGYDYLLGPITRGSGDYTLYLISSAPNDENNDNKLASLLIDSDTLSNLTPGTQAIIEWSMQLVNASAQL